MQELHWGLPVIGYLFLAGVGAGAYTVSATTLLRAGANGQPDKNFDIARYGALLAPLPLIVGTGMIIFELGTFQAAVANGDIGLFFRWINLFLTINMSPMSIGSWVLGVCILASVVYAYTFLSEKSTPDDDNKGLRRKLAWVGIPLGIAVAIYTGVMLGAVPSRPFWNTPMLSLLFLVSALSTGVAGILLVRALFAHNKDTATAEVDSGAYMLTTSDIKLICLELLAIVLFILFAKLTVGNASEAISIILPGGALATMFWGGVVVIGLVLPVLIELKYVIPALRNQQSYAMPRGTEIAVCAVILFGGFMLRYVVVAAGQMTGPMGL